MFSVASSVLDPNNHWNFIGYLVISIVYYIVQARTLMQTKKMMVTSGLDTAYEKLWRSKTKLKIMVTARNPEVDRSLSKGKPAWAGMMAVKHRKD